MCCYDEEWEPRFWLVLIKRPGDIFRPEGQSEEDLDDAIEMAAATFANRPGLEAVAVADGLALDDPYAWLDFRKVGRAAAAKDAAMHPNIDTDLASAQAREPVAVGNAVSDSWAPQPDEPDTRREERPICHKVRAAT